jgi:uncharacterized RDD family membrane protein YckC/type II secretory pathway pseudopilin PulG
MNPEPSAPIILPATILRRLSNLIVDRIISQVIFFIIIIATTFCEKPLSAILSCFAVVVYLGYYLIFESIWQRTPGKWITKTKVVDREGNKPSFLRIVGRSLARFIPFEAFSFLVSSYPMGWHDSLSKTLVVPASYTPDDVKKMNIEEIKQHKSNNTVVVVVILVVGFFVMIAIIGILSSIVLASLSTARQKGNDAAIKSNFSSLELQSLVYEDKTGSFSGLCNDPKTLELLHSASTYSNVNKSPSEFACTDTKLDWIALVAHKPDGYWCVDAMNLEPKIISTITPGQNICK